MDIQNRRANLHRQSGHDALSSGASNSLEDYRSVARGTNSSSLVNYKNARHIWDSQLYLTRERKVRFLSCVDLSMAYLPDRHGVEEPVNQQRDYFLACSHNVAHKDLPVPN